MLGGIFVIAVAAALGVGYMNNEQSHSLVALSFVVGAFAAFTSQVGDPPPFPTGNVTLRYDNPDIAPVDALIHRAKSKDVHQVIVEGAVIYEDGRFTRIDRDAIPGDVIAHLESLPSHAGLGV